LIEIEEKLLDNDFEQLIRHQNEIEIEEENHSNFCC
jgi:hypothetical protein